MLALALLTGLQSTDRATPLAHTTILLGGASTTGGQASTAPKATTQQPHQAQSGPGGSDELMGDWEDVVTHLLPNHHHQHQHQGPSDNQDATTDPEPHDAEGQQQHQHQQHDGQQEGVQGEADQQQEAGTSGGTWGPTALQPRTSPLPSQPLSLDVWVLAGQSNMVGDNAYDGQEVPHALVDPWPGRLLMFANSTGQWQDAEENMHSYAAGCFVGQCRGGVGPAMAFGRALIDLGLSHRVGFIPTASGGSSLAWDWKAGEGKRYWHMINATKRAMEATLAAGRGSAQLRGVLWVQGEADASRVVGSDGAFARAYFANFAAFVRSVRAELGAWHPQLPVVMAKMSVKDREGALPWVREVRGGQERAAAEVPAVVEADMEGLSFFTSDLGKDLGGVTAMHLTKTGACQLGQLMARQYAKSGQQLIRPTEP